MSFRLFQFFLLRTRPCFVSSWPLRENSTTEFLPKSLPGTLYNHRTGSPAVSPDELKLCLLKFFRRRASSRCATADSDQSLLRWGSLAFWSATRTSAASRPREAHL